MQDTNNMTPSLSNKSMTFYSPLALPTNDNYVCILYIILILCMIFNIYEL
jgi:hypothetical protein